MGAGQVARGQALSRGLFSWRRLTVYVLVVVPVAAWFIVKPVRVAAPTLAQVTCVSETVCVDDAGRAEEAKKLYLEAEQFVSEKVEQIGRSPRVVFCATETCAQNFGLGPRAAVTVGTLGIVIGPRAWTDYLVRHEMIHYVQGRRINVLRLLFKPEWFVEGMAYDLSEDPRVPLSEPFESWRSEFRAWHKQVGQERLWVEGRKL